METMVDTEVGASKASQQVMSGGHRIIRKVAVLGSGVMGSQIACHFANIGVEALLLDIPPKDLNELESKKGLTLESPIVRNRIVNESLQKAIKLKPAPLYKKEYANRVSTGNLEDDLSKVSDVDWIIEVVVENLDIKKKLYQNIEKYRKPGTLITTNTSGIPISMLTEGRSDDFRANFCGTHFFNPPRYLTLLEIIPGAETKKEVLDFLMHYGDLHLGKNTVLCKDTPAFIANRIGVFAIMDALKVIDELDLTVDEVDKLTGPVIGRPKSATFRTMDVVGNDTMINVTNNLYLALQKDERRDTFKLSTLLETIKENKWYGQKSGQGFYKKIKGDDGKSEILSLNLKTFEYEPKKKVKFATLEQAKSVDDLKKRLKVLVAGKDVAGEFFRRTFYSVFEYVSNRIPEIADDIYKIDEALKAGFGWKLGPFEMWDAVGVRETVAKMKESGFEPNQWVYDMLNAGIDSFYSVKEGNKNCYQVQNKDMELIPGLEGFILLNNCKDNVVWENAGVTLYDIGDGVLNLEFHTKMNSLGGEVIQGINYAINLAEEQYNGLVIANEGDHFSAGANLALLLMNSMEQEWDEVNMMIKTFQDTMMRCRYSSIPVVVAPHGMALGGGCEIALHADKIQAHAELYMGLVEFGVGLIPAGGGTKEFTLRVSDSLQDGDIAVNDYKNAFLTIGMAKVSTSAYEAIDIGYLKKSDGVTMNKARQIQDAKQKVLEMYNAGYVQPLQRKDIKVYGKQILGMFYAGANSMRSGNYISKHDELISRKLAYVMAGGDLSAPTEVSEQYLLDLEREAFLSLCGETKTLERIQHMLTTGKPLRN